MSELRMVSPRWEHGSDFHWPSFDVAPGDGLPPWPHGAAFFATGRDCIAAAARLRSSPSVWIPSYFCQDVLAGLLGRDLNLRVYQDRPAATPHLEYGKLRPDDIVVVVNYFGLRAEVNLPSVEATGAIVLEDHTHDPWSPWAFRSNAHYCMAALRKTLPVGDGAVIWSPRGLPSPIVGSASRASELAAGKRTQAAILKALYLGGHAVDKTLFRAFAVESEKALVGESGSGITRLSRQLIDVFPWRAWRDLRKRNLAYFEHELAANSDITILAPESVACVPYVALLPFSNRSDRDSVRSALIEESIYPALLWNLDEPVVEGVTEADKALASRSLAIHCDWRYRLEDMRRVVEVLADAT